MSEERSAGIVESAAGSFLCDVCGRMVGVTVRVQGSRLYWCLECHRQQFPSAKPLYSELELENAALRAQLAEQEQRLAASEALLANVSQVHVGLVKLEQTTRGKIALSRLNTRRGVLEHQSTQATNMTDAYLAAVAQGWLPEPKKGA